ncbi:hypothetical protein EDB83DRAFT_2312676 [Lactarius deliciosus]|nr:hypothetical protein EDB83DRAFT_2312676 [Lactarius deliciosus]
MSTGKVPRLDRVLRVASQRNMSLPSILELISKAVQGLYCPKGFNEEEDLQTLLLLRLGGRPVVHVVLMLDEIAQEKRPRWTWFAVKFTLHTSCKKERAEDHAILIQTALDAITHLRPHTNIRVVCVVTDGEARRGKALAQLMFKRMLSPTSDIYHWLSSCPLLDLHVGDNDLTCDKDCKHTAAKRPRNALLREKGVLVYGTWITPSVLRGHLLDAGHKSDHIQAVLNPNDKQDVTLAYMLLRDIWSLPMLALVLYVHENACGNFLPTALYCDIILMIKNVFFCVVKAKVDTPNDDFNIVLLGTDRLETLFGCLRTVVGNDTNVDTYQLGSRLTGTMESASILALHPEWDKAPRRLKLPSLDQNMDIIPNCADHISPHSWRASQSLQSMTPPTVWIQGRRRLEVKYPFTAEILRNIKATPNSSMLAPFGTLLIHASPLPDDMEDPHDDLLHGLDPEAVLPKGADMPLTSSGMYELEDMATHPRWSPEEHGFGRTVSVDNGSTMLGKSNALALLFKYSKTTGSADRLCQVQQQARFIMPQFDPTWREPHSDEQDDILLVNNLVASLLSCEDKLFLGIGEILSIHMDSKSVDHIPIDVLPEDTIRVTYQVYNLISTSLDDDSSYSNLNNWRTRELLPMKFKVPGALVQPINPVLGVADEIACCSARPSENHLGSKNREAGHSSKVMEHMAPNIEWHVRRRGGRHRGVDPDKHRDLWEVMQEEKTAMVEIWKRRSDSDTAEESTRGHESDADGNDDLSNRSGVIASEAETQDEIGASCNRSGHQGPPESKRLEHDGKCGLTGSSEMVEIVANSVSVNKIAGANKDVHDDANIWVSPTALGGATPMNSGAANAPVEAQIETIEGQLLQDAQVSSFGRKRKIRNMAEISACLCGQSAAPRVDAGSVGSNVVCCRIPRCKTKWYHLTCVGLSSSSNRSWICEVCLSDAGPSKHKRV